MSALAGLLDDFVMADGLAEHETSPHCNAVMLNARTVGSERQSKSPSILGGVGLKRDNPGPFQACHNLRVLAQAGCHPQLP